ncbi:hypothetical protein [Parvicella tangerina]|uniref:Uncharacterized protein n=1 Tax=Parvicella tangerina TaxID=2829795 RepID=A0A916JP76_9FLAO|nr:hypothetical protein [Parvicella tangerina]CAG5085771.1 hypothetical protein CRYO30217_02878 [Parvicella tangerina]
MKNVFIFSLFLLFLVSCQEEATTSEEKTQKEIPQNEVAQNSEETPADFKQTNVVTPEFWDSYDTDVVMIFYYNKKESSGDKIHQVKEEVLNNEESLGYEFHEYYTDENMGMVQVDDNVFFNLTEYLWNNDEGFVLLKKGSLKHIPGAEVNETTFKDAVKPFFE